MNIWRMIESPRIRVAALAAPASIADNGKVKFGSSYRRRRQAYSPVSSRRLVRKAFRRTSILEAGTCHGVVERPLRAKTTPAGMYVLLERAPQVAERHIPSVADDVF